MSQSPAASTHPEGLSMLEKAGTDAEREAAKKDLAHWQQNLAEGEAALQGAVAARQPAGGRRVKGGGRGAQSGLPVPGARCLARGRSIIMRA